MTMSPDGHGRGGGVVGRGERTRGERKRRHIGEAQVGYILVTGPRGVGRLPAAMEAVPCSISLARTLWQVIGRRRQTQ